MLEQRRQYPVGLLVLQFHYTKENPGKQVVAADPRTSEVFPGLPGKAGKISEV
jgi:hypothetical protein